MRPDSSEDLQSVDPSKAYIIGGLVDRNQHKNLCLDKAAGQGIATARLPIGTHLRMAGSPILTINQVGNHCWSIRSDQPARCLWQLNIAA